MTDFNTNMYFSAGVTMRKIFTTLKI